MTLQTVVPTRYWHRIDTGQIQCDVCPRACKLRDGQQGLCFVRACQDDKIVLTTYGRSSGFCVSSSCSGLLKGAQRKVLFNSRSGGRSGQLPG